MYCSTHMIQLNGSSLWIWETPFYTVSRGHIQTSFGSLFALFLIHGWCMMETHSQYLNRWNLSLAPILSLHNGPYVLARLQHLPNESGKYLLLYHQSYIWCVQRRADDCWLRPMLHQLVASSHWSWRFLTFLYLNWLSSLTSVRESPWMDPPTIMHAPSQGSTAS